MSGDEKSIHPEEWMQKRFPDVLSSSRRAFRLTKGGKVKNLGADLVLADCFGREGSPEAPLAYCPEEKSFYGYDPGGGIYRKLDDEQVVERIDRVFERCARECAEDHRPPVNGVRTVRKLENIRSALRSKSRISADRFRRSTRLLHVENGILDLEERELRPFSSEHPARWKLPIAWQDCPSYPRRFVDFLRTLFPRPADRDLALTVMAMALLGNPFQKVVFLVGPGGSGKSTFVKLMEELVGPEAATQLNLPHADERFQPAEWEGKLLLHQEEADSEMLRKNARVLKALSGGDRIAAERKYRQERTRFTPRALPVLSSNEDLRLPLDGDESAWERRLLVLQPTEEALPEGERVPDYERVLLREDGSGILRLVATRAQRLLKRLDQGRGFPSLTPRQVARIHDLLKGSDPLAYFIKQRVKAAPDAELHAGELKEAYRRWWDRNGSSAPRNVQITRRIRELVEARGGTYAKSLSDHPRHSSRGWRGVRIA